MKIITLHFKIEYIENPTLIERINLIEKCLQENSNVDILICSEAYLSLLRGNYFTALDANNINTPESGYENNYNIQHELRSQVECYSEQELLRLLKNISTKYPNVLIIPGTSFIRSGYILNKAYIIKNEEVKEHYKSNTFHGFYKMFEFLPNDQQDLRETNIFTKYLDYTDYEVALSICADTCPRRMLRRRDLSLLISLSYGLAKTFKSEITSITQNVDFYIQVDAEHLDVSIIKNPTYSGTFSKTEIGVHKSIKCYLVELKKPEFQVKYLKYKNKYLQLKDLLQNSKLYN